MAEDVLSVEDVLSAIYMLQLLHKVRVLFKDKLRTHEIQIGNHGICTFDQVPRRDGGSTDLYGGITLRFMYMDFKICYVFRLSVSFC